MRSHVVALLAAVLLAATALAGSSPQASGDLYAPGTTGYDLSYPQCKVDTPRDGFVILGVNHGRPFRFNDCLRSQYASADRSNSVSLYINTAYDRFYDRWVTPRCTTFSGGTSGSSEDDHAWAIGCSEAMTATDFAKRSGVPVRQMVWLDVETDNSWSDQHLDLNRSVIQGAAAYLGLLGASVGIYSNSTWWNSITGGDWNPAGVGADWVGTVSEDSAQSYCGDGFSAHPVWLVQYIRDGYDHDFACPNS